jgi:hypothetical protein
MELQVFSVYDQKAKAFLPPFFFHNEGIARRTFMDMVNKKDHQWNAHPEDYTLFKIGRFDDNSGEMIGVSPETLVNGLQVIDDALGMDGLENVLANLDSLKELVIKLDEKL